MSLNGVEGGEAPVGADGRFLIGGLNPETYVLLVLDGTTVLHTRAIGTNSDVVINLAKR